MKSKTYMNTLFVATTMAFMVGVLAIPLEQWALLASCICFQPFAFLTFKTLNVLKDSNQEYVDRTYRAENLVREYRYIQRAVDTRQEINRKPSAGDEVLALTTKNKTVSGTLLDESYVFSEGNPIRITAAWKKELTDPCIVLGLEQEIDSAVTSHKKAQEEYTSRKGGG